LAISTEARDEGSQRLRFAALQADGTTLALRTRLPRYDENYSIVVEAPQGKPGHTATASVGKFFTKVRVLQTWARLVFAGS